MLFTSSKRNTNWGSMRSLFSLLSSIFFLVTWKTTLFLIHISWENSISLQIHSSMHISLYLSFPYGVCYSIPLLFSQLFTNLDNSRNSVYLVPWYSDIAISSHHYSIILSTLTWSILNIPFMIDKTIMILILVFW